MLPDNLKEFATKPIQVLDKGEVLLVDVMGGEQDIIDAARVSYGTGTKLERLKFGVAREQARKDLPLSNMTDAFWKCDLHNLLNFLRLRLDPHAQLEIRLYAEAIATIVKAWVPTVWSAFEDYILGAETFSRQEMEGLRAILKDMVPDAVVGSGLKGREAAEFRDKLKRLLED